MRVIFASLLLVLSGATYAMANEVDEVCPDEGILEISVTGSSISNGQQIISVENVTNNNTKDHLTLGCIQITVSKNNGSSNVTEWVKSALSSIGIPWEGNYATHTRIGGSSLPSDLNVAVQGTLTYTNAAAGVPYSCTAENVIIAQGHTGLGDNWWLWNNTTSKNNYISCTSGSGLYVKGSAASSNVFYLTPTKKHT